MTDLVVSENPDAEDSASHLDDEYLQSQLEEIAAEKEDVLAQISRIMDRIKYMFKVMSAHNQDLEEDVRALAKEIRDLQAKMRKETEQVFEERKADYEEDDLDEEFSEYDQTYESFSSSSTAPKEEEPEDPKIAKLFRKIAQKTHPDKTDDPELQMLFVTAKKCRDNHDLKGLQDIWDYITGKTSRLMSKLMERLQAAIDELRLIKYQLVSLQNTSDYVLVTHFEKNQQIVLDATRNQLYQKRLALMEQLDILRRLAGEPAPTARSSLIIEKY